MNDKIIEVLKTVVDPEIKFNLIDLGLIYGIEHKSETDLIIKMTLTTPACPFGNYLKAQVVKKLKSAGYSATVDWVWSPLWQPETMASDEVKDFLGLW